MAEKTANLTLIISVYRNVRYLELVLAGIAAQLLEDFEVIIADDGSPKNELEQMQTLADNLPVTASIVHHEDKGFRKNRILNRAIEASKTDYLVFIDGDCIPHPAFLLEHFAMREPRVCLTGRRVHLSEKITKRLTPEKVRRGWLQQNFPALLFDSIFGESFYTEKGLYLQSPPLRKMMNKKERGLLGSNFSLHKEDFLRINGFDERYEAPSIGEDSDVQHRLELDGVRIKGLNNIAVQYHLHHKLQDRPQENLDLFKKVKASGIARTPFGIIRKKNA